MRTERQELEELLQLILELKEYLLKESATNK